MLEFDFESGVGYWVCSTSHALRRALDTELSRENITFRQFEVLACLAIHGEQSQVAMAEQLGIEAPTLAGIVARMERDGWLDRTSCTNDRRRKLIRPTSKAEAVWNRMTECCMRVRAKAIDGLSPDQLQTFKEVCERIRANLAETDAPGAECPLTVESSSAAE